jgi:predicted Fe-Mo cluster-binding NifX family protein
MNVLITGSAGEGFVRHLATRGVLVVATNEINPARAVEAYLDGRVRSPSTGCNHDHGKADGKKHTHDSRGDEACSCQG